MKQEIKRSGWSRFCKRFSFGNQYRHTRISGTVSGEVELGHSYPFLGITLEKKGRQIGAIQVLAGRGDAQQVMEPVVSIKQLAKMVLEKDSKGNASRLLLQSKDGTTVNIDLYGDKEPSQHRSLIERVAYSMHERRGSAIGDDWNDWLEAEKRVKEAERQLTE
ncbi:MAG: DUF2934 domain-containing protein [candidate division Zixibacteria bacterium]|nr:DUF2934 domain-containing protein [candidate division Zixibacteria bacterium]